MKQILMKPETIEKEIKVEKQKIPKEEVKEKVEIKEKSLSDLPGIGQATVEKLEASGYHDLM